MVSGFHRGEKVRVSIFGQTAFACLAGMAVSVVSVYVAEGVGWTLSAAVFLFLALLDAWLMRKDTRDGRKD